MRLLPRSIPGQLLVVWVLAMLVAHGIAVFMMSWWRADHLSIHPMSARTMETRTAPAYHLVAQESERDALLRKISLPDSVFHVAPGHTVSPEMDAQEAGIARAQRKMLNLPPDWPVRVQLKQIALGEEGGDAPNWLEKMLGGKQSWELDIEVGLPDGQVLIGDHRPNIMPAHWSQILSFSLLVGMAPITLIAILFGRRIMRPLKTLTEAAKRVSRGEQVRLPPVRGPDGVREITQAFNDMQENLMRFVQGRTMTLAAIGHDLRTPLTSLRIRAELVEDEALRLAMVRTLDDMQLMLEATLRFAKDDALQEPTQEVRLNALLEEIVGDQRMRGRHVGYQSQLSDNFTYRCRPVHLKRAVHNLIDNAACHGAVEVRLLAAGGRLRIEVSDHGPGIPPDQLEHVFEPFVRLDPARSRETGGAGLGLTNAHTCVRAHGGDITLANRESGGLRAVIELPA